jgi:hypothetical protein
MLYDRRWEEQIPEVKAPELEGWQKAILEAREILDRHGWVQGQFENLNGYCIIGALRHTETCDYSLAAIKLDQHVMRKTGGRICSVMAWNDMSGRTKGEVLDLMYEVAMGRPHQTVPGQIVVDASSWTGR